MSTLQTGPWHSRRIGFVMVALLQACLFSVAPTWGQTSDTFLAAAGTGVPAAGSNLNGVDLTSTRFGIGASLLGDGTAIGQIQFTLLGTDTATSEPREIVLDGRVQSWTLVGSALEVQAVMTLDMDDGNPVQTAVPLVLSYDSSVPTGLDLAIDTSTNVATTIAPESITTSECTLPDEAALDLVFTAVDTLEWMDPGGVASFNIHRGAVSSPWVFNHACDQAEVTGSSATVSTIPAAGTADYFLLSSNNACGNGVVGFQSDGALRPDVNPCF